HDGKDFREIIKAFRQLGLHVGALVIDAERFVPQSRPRLFIIGVSTTDRVPKDLLADFPNDDWHPAPLKRAYMRLDPPEKGAWLWWQTPLPRKRTTTFADIIESNPQDVEWHSREETKRLLELMARPHKKKVDQAKRAGRPMVGAIYKRTRRDADGNKIQRAEV